MKRDQFNLFIKFVKYLSPYWKKEMTVIILSLAGVLLSLINPYLTKFVIDKGFINKDLRIFVILTFIGASVFFLSSLLDGFRSYLDRYIKIRVNFDLNRKLFRHIAKLDLFYFQAKSSGEHLYKIGFDVERVKELITTVPPDAITLFPKLLFTIVIVFYLNWRMALVSIFFIPFLYIPPFIFTKRMRFILEKWIKNSEGIFRRLSEFFSNIYLIKAFGKENNEVRQYMSSLISNIRIKIENTKLEITNIFTQGAMHKFIVGIIAFYGGYQVIKGKMTLGSLTAIMVYFGQLVGLQSRFALFFQEMVMGLISCGRIDAILKRRSMVTPGSKNVSFESAEIIFRDITFGYIEKKPVVSSISLSVKSGSHVAIVGYSGCGKTTLLNLLLKLYEPWQGEILIDSHNIKDIKLDSLRGQIGIALQNPFLWNDTIENNIRYGKDDASWEEIAYVAGICGVDSFIKDFSRGYQTVIGEKGTKISEGQKQKIAIARALIKNPKILILDEAMSSMDSASEESILSNIKKNYKGLTSVAASHRLSAAMEADLVYFLNRQGQVTVGHAEELLEGNREFCDLFRSQIKNGILTL